jgi:hypothetical protein
MRSGQARQGKARQGKARQGKARQGKARHFHTKEQSDNELLKIIFLAAFQKDQTNDNYQHLKTFKVNE